MKVILKETIDALGVIGSEVTVAPGYARNFLLPQNKAVLATDANRRALAQEKVKFELQIAKEKKTAEQIAQKIEGVKCRVAAKVSEEDRLYGSVTARDILTALAAQGIEIQKRMILLSDPIKTLGVFKVPIRVYADVEPEIEVEIIPE